MLNFEMFPKNILQMSHESGFDLDARPTPEKRLVLAVLGRALADALGRTASVRPYRRAARAWVHSNSARKWGFRWCLDQVCDDSDGLAQVIRKAISSESTKIAVCEILGRGKKGALAGKK